MSDDKTINWVNLSAKELTEELDVFVGGDGGLSRKGLVPANDPADGLGAKFLSDDPVTPWKIPPGGGGGSKFTASFGNGVLLSFIIAHGRATADIIPYVRKISDGSKANCTIRNDVTNVYIDFAGTPPTLNEFRLVVLA
jgi:hypothetical protein